jgi:hypothetical protein
MTHDFEFRQLLRTLRKGIISESTFEAEFAEIERSAARSNGGRREGFEAFGRSYRSEQAAIVSFIDKARVGEKNGAEAFAAWAEVCKTDCIRLGLRMPSGNRTTRACSSVASPSSAPSNAQR